MFNSGSGLSASDVLALSNNDGFGGNNGAWWIVILAILFGWGGNGFGGYGGSAGAQMNYVLSSDFATLQRQLSDGFGATESKLDSISNGICSLGYDQLSQMNGINMNIMQGTNTLQGAVKDCCCQTQQNIKDTQYSIATTGANINAAIKDCCCENEKIAMQNRYDSAQNQCQTLQAIDKLGDRIIGYMDNQNTQNLRDELQAYKWQASQDRQNLFIQNLVKPQINPCYVTQNPYCSCGNANPYGFNGYYGTTIA